MTEHEPVSINLDPRTTFGRLEQIEAVYGRVGARLLIGIHEKRIPAFEDVLQVNQEFYRRVDERFGLDQIEDPFYQIGSIPFYLIQRQTANAVVGALARSITPRGSGEVEVDAGALALKEEIAHPSESAVDALFFLAGNSDDMLRQQVRRALILSEISGHIYARSLHLRVLTRISDIQKRFDERLWEGPMGTTIPLHVHSVHDNVTNSLVDEPQFAPPNLNRLKKKKGQKMHAKTHDYRIRRVRNDLGFDRPILFNPSKKTMVQGVTKGVRKGLRAHLRSIEAARSSPETLVASPLVVPSDVRDVMRMMFVVFGDENDVDRFIELSLAAMAEPTDFDTIAARVIRVEPDDETGEPGENNNEEPPFRKKVAFKRRRVYFDNLPPDVYMELIFYTGKDYLTGEWEIGRFYEDRGDYNGRSHGLYDLDRNFPVFKWAFPYETHGVPIPEWVVAKRHEVADDLRYGGRRRDF